jgi:hypothetical protein
MFPVRCLPICAGSIRSSIPEDEKAALGDDWVTPLLRKIDAFG